MKKKTFSIQNFKFQTIFYFHYHALINFSSQIGVFLAKTSRNERQLFAKCARSSRRDATK